MKVVGGFYIVNGGKFYDIEKIKVCGKQLKIRKEKNKIKCLCF
jgi:hypothetical protein